MAVKVNKMADQMPRFKTLLAKLHEKEGKELAKQAQAKAEELLGLTFDDAYLGFQQARVKIEKTVTKTAKGCIVKMHFFVAGAGGKPHVVWHVVNRGRATGPIKSNIAFRPRKKPNRTTPGSLRLRPYQGEDEIQFRSEGYVMKGFEGRHFYDTAMNKLTFSLFSSGRFRDWKITNKEVKDD